MFFNLTLIGILIYAILVFVIGLSKHSKCYLVVIVTAIAFFLIFKSRSGLLGFVVSLLFLLRYNNIGGKRIRIKFVPALLFSFGLFILLLSFKPGSSQGRRLIYNLALQIYANKRFNGIGLGRFKATYNEVQADYFTNHNIDGNDALLADNTFYAFNDYLQWGIETGLAGIFLLAAIIYLLIERVRNILREKEKPRMVVAAAAGLICIGTASLFSYPMQVWPIQALALIYTGVILYYPWVNSKAKLHRLVLYAFRLLFIFLSVYFLVGVFADFERRRLAKDAFHFSRIGYKHKTIALYQKLSNRWPSHGYNTLSLAEQYYYTNKLCDALHVLEGSKKYYVENKTYLLQAKIFNELGDYPAAEKSYLRAIYMVPNRMGSRFEIMNFYIERKDTTNAVKWANSILQMPVKVPSARTELMQEQAQKIKNKLGF